MKKSKNTKYALFASILSMILCCAMLIGSTFAWFTDSVSSAKNKILAGNLDVELYTKSGTDYAPVTADTNLFLENTLWEPGHVEVVNLKVANLGTLALQYKLGLNVAAEKTGTNIAGQTFKLSDYIMFALLDGEQTYTTRDAAIAAAEADAVALSALAVDENGVLYPEGKGTSEQLVTLIVYMPATVGNDANYKTGTAAPEIDLGVTLVATQTSFEKDSFGDNYDEDAPAISYKVTPENIASYLNGEHGSMTNAKLILAPGNYQNLVVGAPSKYADSDTVYTCPTGSDHSETPVAFVDADEYKAHINDGKWHGYARYERSIDNLTLVGQEGVIVEGLTISSGHMYGGYNPVLEKDGGYYLTQSLKKVTFQNISFTSQVNIATSQAETVIDGVTFDHCSFTTNGTASTNKAGLRYYNESNNGGVKNLTVKDCSFNNCYQGIYTGQVVGITVTGCTFDTTGHNAIAVQSNVHGPVNHKAIVIEKNNFNQIGDRIIRFGEIGADTQITIQNNTAVNSGDSEGEIIKAVSLADGITYNISNNSWGENTKVANPEFADK